MGNKIPDCNGCEFLRCFNYVHKNYYCDNEERMDDMGKVSVDNAPKTSPEWCPKKEQ